MNNVVSLTAVRELRKAKEENPSYQTQVQCMSKLQLLDEMMKFQESRSRIDHLTLEMMIQGQALFGALEKVAESEELRMLAHSYHRHLKYELDAYLKIQA